MLLNSISEASYSDTSEVVAIGHAYPITHENLASRITYSPLHPEILIPTGLPLCIPSSYRVLEDVWTLGVELVATLRRRYAINKAPLSKYLK
jgi:hypothetical protein